MLISTPCLQSCTHRTSKGEETNKPKECETLFGSIFSLNLENNLRSDYLNQFSIDSNTFNTYVIYPILKANKEEHFKCKEYIMNQTDFMPDELDNRDGIYFCIDSNNTTFYFGIDIDPEKVGYSVHYFLNQWYKELKNKSENYIYSDSINIRIDIHCEAKIMQQPSFDWSNFIFILNEIYYTLHQFREFILNDTLGITLKDANETQLEVINKFYSPLIYIEHSEMDCMPFEQPTPNKTP